jgi:hypothetical protein
MDGLSRMYECDENLYTENTKHVKGRDNLGSSAIMWEVNIRV